MNVTAQTLELMKQALAKGDIELAKSISIATGLVAYDLQAPAKNLYPILTPLRNSLPRVPGNGGTATNWKEITSIVGSGYDSTPWVPEGQRTARMNYVAADKAATYRTIGEEDQVSFEAVSAAQGFEDVQATMTMRLLQKMMVKEESALLGGNASVALGTPTTPTTSASGTGGTLPTLTYDVAVVALTYEGYWNASRSAPLSVALSTAFTGADGQSYTLKGGSSNKSAVQTQAITLGQHLFASTPAITGAVAYAWYIGAAGAARLEAITTINSLDFSTALAGTGQLLSAVIADNSRNDTLGFDGMLYAAYSAPALSYFKSLATGTAGTGTVLTGSGRGSVVEVDTMLRAMWDGYRLSPTVLYVNAQEMQNMLTKVLTGASAAPLVRFNMDAVGAATIMAGQVIGSYFNPFSINGGMVIPIRIHPTLPPGTIMGYCENLPAQYQSNNVPNTAEVHYRRDYYQIDWPLRTRQRESGVYAEEVLAVYAKFGVGLITNIANG